MRLRTKLSSACRGQSRFSTAGNTGRIGRTNDQWVSYAPPSSIHCARISIWPAVSPASGGGGIRTSGSSLEMRRKTSLSAAIPGRIAGRPSRAAWAADCKSSRKSASRESSSGPWQPKHFAARIGRTSRLKSTGPAAWARCGAQRTIAMVAGKWHRSILEFTVLDLRGYVQSISAVK